jgi:ATP-dependent DNA helicase RecG
VSIQRTHGPPIPRSLALTRYGDLDMSVLRQRPPGRGSIRTSIRSATDRTKVLDFVHEVARAGGQAYVVLPVIEETEKADLLAAKTMADTLTARWDDPEGGLVHGRLKATERDLVMRKFRAGAIQVLVATTVIEVGIDVPNATVMLIEDAERFGLSQLHQFRGRVGRGAVQSYCYLLSESSSMVASERLGILERTTDGFKLAEEDLRLRGPGDFFGTRQSGLPELKVATMADTQLLVEARVEAEELWKRDPYLRALEHAALRERVFLFWRNFAGH